MRLVLYTGKGGVGKTTTAAATAACAAGRGLRTLVLSADAAHSLGDVLGLRLGPEPAGVAPGLDALEVDARAEMAQHWGRIRDYLVSLFRHQGIEEVVAEELALLPGAEELTTLLAVERHAASGRYDLVVVDCAPTGSALRLLSFPEVAHGALRVLLRLQQALAALVTPLARHLIAVPLPEAGVFGDANRLLYSRLRALRERITSDETSVRLVVTPERMVIDEARRAHTDLVLFEVPCDAVVLNRMLPEAAAEEEFFRGWSRLQEERRREVEALFAPLPVLSSPLREDEIVGLDALRAHGEALFAEHGPDARLAPSTPVRFVREQGGYRVEIPLPHAEHGELEISRVEDDLLIRYGPMRRALRLPPRMAALEVAGARLEDGALRVRLGVATVEPNP